MGKIDVCDLEPGMVVASDIKAWNGRFLLGKGVRLTSGHLQTIKTWGIVDADVEGASENDLHAKRTADIDPAILEVADELTLKRFMHVDLAHDATRRLFQICVLRKAQEIASGADPDGFEAKYNQSSDEESRTPLSEVTAPQTNIPDLIRKKIRLPSLPVIFSQIIEAINDPRSSATQVARIIRKDASLSARLLKIVNSVFYSIPSRIDTVSRAVAIIGTRELSTLALGITAMEVFEQIPSDLVDMKSFWKHNIATGIMARIISSYHSSTVTERFFLAGLLHDIGRLVMFKCCPVEAKEALLRARKTNSLLCNTEQEVMGYNHAAVGGMLLKEWRLPIALETSVRHHHEPTGSHACLEHAVVHISDIIANALGIGTSGELFVPPLDTNAWEQIGLSTGLLSAAISQAYPNIDETVHIFFPND